MTIEQLSKIQSHSLINFKALSDGAGINYGTLYQKVQLNRELKVTESQQIEQYLSANGIHWETLIQNR